MGNVTPEFAEILGLLCAEGCYVVQYDTYWGKDGNKTRFYDHHKSERVEFFNKDKKLLERLKELLAKEFNYSANITPLGKINICNRKVIGEILNQTKLGHLKWRVPEQIMNSCETVKISFVRGYFDGDGTISNRARLFSTNFAGLKQVSKLLEDLQIKHTFPYPQIKEKRKPIYSIQIMEKEKQRFLNLVKPISKRPGIRRG